MNIRRFIGFFCFSVFCFSCTNDKKEVEALFTEEDLKVEVVKDVEIFYSDSAQVKIVIRSPIMKRFVEHSYSNDEFPEGIFVEFMNDKQQAVSWLESKYAIRSNKERKIYVRDSVVFYNRDQDKLTTSELIWDEGAGEIYTDKFVRISQPAKRDTSYGYGFKANEDLSRFEILNFQAVKNAKVLQENFEQ